jgi:hypothetical protein|tara:strand:+ start:127 stop:393 length:267 start_codon:yes stop_codon:yes gene_type:complete
MRQRSESPFRTSSHSPGKQIEASLSVGKNRKSQKGSIQKKGRQVLSQTVKFKTNTAARESPTFKKYPIIVAPGDELLNTIIEKKRDVA